MIGLMDCNNFFVSCERLFRPDLAKKPVLVLSSNDGCVVSRSQEVKDLGIPMGAPFFQIKEICKKNKVHIFSSNFPLYRDLSQRVMSALREEFDDCEIYSVDESFFFIKDTVSFTDLVSKRSRIMQKSGIPVSIGVSYTKTLAKIAGSYAKRGEGVCIFTQEFWEVQKQLVSCGSVWGIGRKMSAHLSRLGITTVRELLETDRSYIRQEFGVVGERICMELEGKMVYPMHQTHKIQQSYMSTRSFGEVIQSKTILRVALGHHVTNLALKLRKDACVASGMTVLLRGSRYGTYAHRKSLFFKEFTQPTADTTVLLQGMESLLTQAFDPKIPYKKAGVILQGIVPKDVQTEQLFPKNIDQEWSAIDVLSDDLNERFGAQIIQRGSLIGSSLWITKKTFFSKRYTTVWSEIPKVKAA